MPEYLCRNCFTSFIRYSTVQRLCGKCSYNAYSKPKKPIKRIGKVTRAWIETRAEWIKLNPPSHEGYYECYLQIHPNCPKWITVDELQVDHVKARTRQPNLRNDLKNLKPSCGFCNEMKGSKDLEDS